jgi:hypothetical protein
VGGGVTGKNGFAGLGGNAIDQAIFVARSKPIFVLDPAPCTRELR